MGVDKDKPRVLYLTNEEYQKVQKSLPPGSSVTFSITDSYGDRSGPLIINFTKGDRNYIKRSKEIVLELLEEAYSELGRPVSAREVRVGGEYLPNAPQTSYSYYPQIGRSEGGHSVVDFTDRVQRYLVRLAKEGKIRMIKRGREYFFAPLEVDR